MSRAGRAFAVIRDGGETEKAADKTVRIFRSFSVRRAAVALMRRAAGISCAEMEQVVEISH
ncbi:hypothetical protein BIY26_05245 [Brenneria goodwinii]|uniref:Uncharacterized protein n=1 Tax=Brenneria goodwinii TaxID=1109412 RepID=A0AAE8ESY5_9GAMM|nr:hypothetical protein AWC36_18005 [Brenneria goodwinii]RLM27913.1 hypothetical protein BIY26_05245 [Brenneria goodwinii]